MMIRRLIQNRGDQAAAAFSAEIGTDEIVFKICEAIW